MVDDLPDAEPAKVPGAPTSHDVAALLAQPLPHFTVNAVANVVTLTEVSTVLFFSGRPVAITTMSFTMAKSYGNMLLEAVERYEAGTEVPVLTLDQVAERLRAKGQIP